MLKGGKVSHAAFMTGAKEVYLKQGDALLFVDSLCHGSAKRANKGERRVVIYRYGPSWGFFRHPYRPSKQLLKKLNKFFFEKTKFSNKFIISICFGLISN